MSDWRAEDVKEALEQFLAREPEIPFDLHDNLRTVFAAARAWANPGYGAAKSLIVKLVVLAEQADPLADDWEFWAKSIVDAALSGNPQPEGQT